MTSTKGPMTDGNGGLLTIREVAALDRCSEKTVRRAITAGLLSALRVGPGERLLRVTKEAHAAYRKAQRL
ncbi:helix-turn-helix domain-containing protein [Rhodobacter sp. KR11]|uniref:helix-turn-helix domain-containing protein n=1 Tax=Rhodobacter sp. KR11 TaxID=2974588 RepID=UPI0022233B94|nr:helix-turn-helix domain-containing protein [Rhodobacter sp. KR11]MCW1920861.1 helix-turn-helix domain-containing protein [Rhodobacter sp. KR11]